MEVKIDNFSGLEGSVDIDGVGFSIPVGSHTLTIDESLQMMPGESTVTWDPFGGMYMGSMDAGDVLVVDQSGQATFHSIEVAPESGGGSLVPIEVAMTGVGSGGVIAATVLVFVGLKKALLEGHTWD